MYQTSPEVGKARIYSPTCLTEEPVLVRQIYYPSKIMSSLGTFAKASDTRTSYFGLGESRHCCNYIPIQMKVWSKLTILI